ncbi:MAG: hypothetical protein MUE63_01245 [Xanthomonadales bacterium]|nr:hypothetical protein [Xanthomonadales bacterium]
MTTPPASPETDAPTGTAAGMAAGGMAIARAPSLGAILLDRRQREPGRPLLVLATGLTPSPRVSAALHSLLETLQAGAASPLVLTVLSNAAAEFNPWSGLAPPDAPSDIPSDMPADMPADMLHPALTEGLAALLGPGEVHEWPAWPGHAALLSAAAVEVLARADTTAANAPDRLRAAGGRILVADSLFLHDPRRGLFDRADLEPHEQRSPPPWGGLTERLDDWLRHAAPDDPALAADLERFAAAPAAGAPTLHVTHSWGGGVARWVESFIDADADGTHFQLCAEGPESGKGCGQRLSLYFGNRLTAPVARWWLQPPIRSSTERHPAYRAILDGLLSRYGIGRIVVSSLVAWTPWPPAGPRCRCCTIIFRAGRCSASTRCRTCGRTQPSISSAPPGNTRCCRNSATTTRPAGWPWASAGARPSRPAACAWWRPAIRWSTCCAGWTRPGPAARSTSSRTACRRCRARPRCCRGRAPTGACGSSFPAASRKARASNCCSRRCRN